MSASRWPAGRLGYWMGFVLGFAAGQSIIILWLLVELLPYWRAVHP